MNTRSYLFFLVFFVLIFSIDLSSAGLVDLCENETFLRYYCETNTFHAEGYEITPSGEILLEEGGSYIINKGLPNQIEIKNSQGVKIKNLFTLTSSSNETNFSFSFNGDPFENILNKGLNQNFPKFDLDPEEGNFYNVFFITGGSEGTYRINGFLLKTNPNEKVFYSKEKGINYFNGPKISKIEREIPDKGLKILGENLELENGFKLNGLGILQKDGFLLGKGNVEYRGAEFTVEETKSENLLFLPNSRKDLESYKGNWAFGSDNNLEVSSGKKGTIHLNFLENSAIMNTDSKDKLNFSIQNGDKVFFMNRNDEELIPLISHSPSEGGKTLMDNDGLEFILDEKGLEMTNPPKSLNSEMVENSKYQSTALEISDTSKEEILRINSYRQFVVLDENEREKVSFNKYDLPVSNKINDNQIQTVEQLREKYPGISFEIPKEISEEGGFQKNGLKSNVPPIMIYSVDEYLQKGLTSSKGVKKIEFGSDSEAYADGFGDNKTIYLGMEIIDPATNDLQIREIVSPIEIIKHEGRHILQANIREKEELLRDKLEDPTFRKLSEDLKDLRKKHEKIFSALYGDSDIKLTREEELKLIEEKKRLYREINALDLKLKKMYKDLTGKKTFDNIYGELGTEGTKEFIEGGREQFLRIKEEIDKEFFLEKIDEICKEEYGKGAFEVGKELSNKYSKISALKEGYEPVLYSSVEEFKKLFEEEPSIMNGMLINNLLKERNLNERSLRLLKALENSNKDLSLSASIVKNFKGDGKMNLFSNAVSNIYVFSSTFSPKAKMKIDSLVRKTTGLPYQYALRDYSSGEEVENTLFSEIFTTFLEQPKEIIKKRMDSSQKINERYSLLIQLAFDAGEIETEYYQDVLGVECKEQDCLDKRCVEYKLVCCEEYPNSPNC